MDELRLPAGEAREDERELEKVADRVENEEPRPGRLHERTALPLSASTEDGQKSVIVRPDGRLANIQGEVVTTLSAEQARHEQLRVLKPCISCVHSCFPRKGSDAGREIEAHVSMGKRWSIIAPLESSAEYMHCLAWDKCVHVSQHCLPAWGPDRHVFRRGWLGALKAFLARRKMAPAPPREVKP